LGANYNLLQSLNQPYVWLLQLKLFSFPKIATSCHAKSPSLVNYHLRYTSHATKIINTSRRLKNIKERTFGSFQNPPAPH